MKNITVSIVSGLITFAGLVGCVMYKVNKSKVHIYLNFDEKDREAEKKFIDIWKKNKKYFSHMCISNDDRFSYERRKVRKYSFYIDDYGLNLLDGFIIHF